MKQSSASIRNNGSITFRFGIALLLLLNATSPAAELSSKETSDVLQKLQGHRAKFPALSADFTEERTSRLLAQPLRSQGTITFEVPNKFRRELKGANPSLTVSNGVKLWIYYPNFKEAELYTFGQRAFFDDSIAALTAGLNFEKVDDYYRCRAFQENDAYRLELTPKTGGLKRMLQTLSVWVDDEFNIQKTEAVLPKNDRVVTTYRNQHAAPAAAREFDFQPPADAHISTPLGK